MHVGMEQRRELFFKVTVKCAINNTKYFHFLACILAVWRTQTEKVGGRALQDAKLQNRTKGNESNSAGFDQQKLFWED